MTYFEVYIVFSFKPLIASNQDCHQKYGTFRARKKTHTKRLNLQINDEPQL
jgi:hypothetical protein